MTGTRLPKEYELAVMKKLSTDDAYRARFEKSPSDALKEIGVSESHIAAMDPSNLQPGKLADKAAIAEAYASLDAENLTRHACMIWPLLRMNYGDS